MALSGEALRPLPQRIFLGWDGPQLPALADWLIRDAGTAVDFSSTVLVLSGSRAGRRFRQIFAQRCQETGQLVIPPQVVTPVHAVSALFEEPENLLPSAPDLISRIAWARALADLPERDGLLLSAAWRRGSGWASSSMFALAETLGVICSEVVASGHSVGGVAGWISDPLRGQADQAVRRWQILEAAWREYVRVLEAWGLSDATLWRQRMLSEGRIREDVRLVLAGVVELDGMYAAGFSRLAERACSVIFAPESAGETFDAWGQLRVEDWRHRAAGLNQGELLAVRDAEDQFDAVAEFFGGSGRTSPESFAVCVCDEADTPILRSGLMASGIRLRPPVHVAFEQSRPWQVLERVADILDRSPNSPPAFEQVAALARHPDFRAVFRGRDWSAVLDRFCETHIPEGFDPGAVASGEAGLLQDFAKRLDALLGEPMGPQPLDVLFDRLLAILDQVFGDVEANANVPDENALILPIKRLVETARSTSILAPGVEMEFASFIRCHLRALGGESVPPEFDANTIDVMGWLELPAEDAPCVAVTSLIDGHVPARVVTEDAFLPGRMRRDLGIHDDASRMARDIYVLTSAAAWRKGGLRVLVPRRDSRGEATRPSRILLAGLTGRELAVRWMRLVEPNADRFALPAQSTLEPLRGPQVLLPSQIAEMLPYQRPESLRVSSFRDYLANPRLFFFKHVLKLRSHRDDVRELGPGAVGSLVHELLAAFGRDPLVGDLIDAEAIYAVLIRELDALWKVRFGDLTTAAVQFQKESVAMSLRMFADAQAEQRQLGWRIVWCEGGESDEVSPTATLTKAPDGTVLTVRGRCDRIDFRDSAEPGHARWRVIDYKTSQKPADLRKAHRGPGAEAPWKDLQMPLYHLLFPSFVADFGLVGWSDTDVVDLCYFSIPEDHAACGVSEPCPVEWIDGSEGEKSALAEAKRIALRVWDGQFDEPGRLSDYDDPELRALCGCFNLSDDSESSEEDDE